MNKLLIVILICTAQTSLAHGPLLEAMKEMGVNFKTIAAGIQNGKLTEAELDSSEKLQMAIADASLHYPAIANTDALKIKYLKWMAELSKNSLELEESIEIAMTKDPQDLTDVTFVFVEMNDLRKKGHDEFKDEH